MIKVVENKKHLVIKRDGRQEPYNPDKLYKVALWATEDNEIMAKELIDSMEIKIQNKIPIRKLYAD